MRHVAEVPLARPDFRLARNSQARPDAPYGPEQDAVLSAADEEAARRSLTSWPGYAPTPLVSLTQLAEEAGVGSIHYKDESERFGLGSFKALGGAYAVARLLMAEAARRLDRDEPLSADALDDAGTRPIVSEITVCCATDGNHGRSVAWGAQRFGCRCVIFVHATVSESRKQAIERFGAEVVRVEGNYDDSVRAAQEAASRNGWFVVSDTSYEGYMAIPRDVMAGYSVMAAEVLEQLAEPPTHLFLQTGVGGMAAAVCAVFWRRFGAGRPKTVLVDPERAACWWDSLAAGRPTAVAGELDTVMAGLACGEVSLLAWRILESGTDAVMTLPDAKAEACMRRLADGGHDRPLVAGESAVAGLAALLAAGKDEAARALLGLSADSRVLVIGTEGDTDPAIYEAIVGRPAAAVRAAAVTS